MTSIYPTMTIKGALSDLGKVEHKMVSDGVSDFDCYYVELQPEVWLCEINHNFYIDRPHEIRRLTPELAKQYGLTKHFVIPRGKKNGD